jgi:selenocysteine lyase/cysteine desulfurase
VNIAQAQRLWQPETLYLNTASYGLPPTPAWEELQRVLGDWRGGRTSWEGWGEFTEAARASFARLVGVPTEWIAIGANTSSMVGLVAASLPDGARVVSPIAAGWYAGDDPYSSFYGAPLRLAHDARRFDVSPAWFPWVATAPTLELLLEIGIETIHEHNLRLANRFRAGLGLEPGDSAIVSAELPEAEELLSGTRAMAAARAGLLRTSWHVYNTDDDVEELLGLLG